MALHATVFHLAIPCAELEATSEFYVSRLGCRLARSYDDWITLDFFGAQVVCHLAPNHVDAQPEMYPQRFGLTFRESREFEALLEQARASGVAFFREPFVRFEGRPDEHRSFFLVDPSNNLLEFKWYADAGMMY